MDDSLALALDATFLSAAGEYRQKLAQATGGSAFRQLWHDTSLPYRMHATDPYSKRYLEEVKAIYRGLTTADYDVGAELTSTKQDDEAFQLGHPWSSGDLEVIAVEMAKTVQALMALRTAGAGGKVIEFGAGWGNLALGLAKAGMTVTAVDIDTGFTQRLRRLAAEQRSKLTTFEGTFLDAIHQLDEQFDSIVFQSSFHHCLDFDELLTGLTNKLLAPGGRILFLSEPIHVGLGFPWGIRYDGEALWAVMCNGWLELGFDHDFFIELMLRHGLLLTRVRGITDMLGDGFCATRCEDGLPFADIVLPTRHDAGFHGPTHDLPGVRFVRRKASLPGKGMRACTLTLRNYGPQPLHAHFRAGAELISLLIPAQEQRDLTLTIADADIEMTSEVFIPDQLIGNGDTRELGIALLTARWTKA